MPNTYSITVQNKSGSQQQYALFNKVPQVTGKVQEQIWSNVFATGSGAHDMSVGFSVTNETYAIVGMKKTHPSKKVIVSVAGSKPVTLGRTQADGQAVPGSTLKVIVNQTVPQFSTDALPDSSVPHAFSIQTGEFSNKEAKDNGYMIGVGTEGGNGPAATFTPESNTTYQIQPTNTFYVTVGEYIRGELIDVTKVGKVCPIDFTSLPSEVIVVHDDHGNLTVKK